MFWSKLCKSSWNCAWNLAFPVFISPIVWNMCENLHYESVYFKELHNEQEYYWPTIYRAGTAVVSTITSNNDNYNNKIDIIIIIIIFPFVYLDCTYAKCVARIFLGGRGGVPTLCHPQGSYQIGMTTSTPCFTERDTFSVEQWAWREKQAYEIAA